MVLKYRWDKKALWWWVNGHYIAGNSSQASDLLFKDPVDLSDLYQATGAGGASNLFYGNNIVGGAGGSGVIDIVWMA